MKSSTYFTKQLVILSLTCTALISSYSQAGSSEIYGGNVKVYVEKHGKLKIAGDKQPNGLTISSTSDGKIVVRSRYGTTINGLDENASRNGITLSSAIKDIEIKLDKGYDYIRISDLNVTGKLKIDHSEGGGYTSLNRVVITRDLEIKSKKGQSTSPIPDYRGMRRYPSSSVSLYNIKIGGKAKVDLAEHGYRLAFTDVDVRKDLDVKLKDGKDRISLSGCSNVGGKLKVDTGKGDDSFSSFGTSVGRNLEIKGSDGEDMFSIIGDDSTSGGGDCRGAVTRDTTINMGKGDDTLRISTGLFEGRFKADGSRGSDTYEDLGFNEFNGQSKFKDFELP